MAESQHSQCPVHDLGGFVCLPPACGNVVDADAQSGRGGFNSPHLDNTQSIGEADDLSFENIFLFRSFPILAGTLTRRAPATRWPDTVAFLGEDREYENS